MGFPTISQEVKNVIYLHSSWGRFCSYVSLTWDTPISGWSQWMSPDGTWVRRSPKQATCLTLWMSTIFWMIPCRHKHTQTLISQFTAIKDPRWNKKIIKSSSLCKSISDYSRRRQWHRNQIWIWLLILNKKNHNISNHTAYYLHEQIYHLFWIKTISVPSLRNTQTHTHRNTQTGTRAHTYTDRHTLRHTYKHVHMAL